MLYKTVSVKRVIAKVFTDLDLEDGTHRVTDMIQWAGEALEKIGAFPQFLHKVTGKNDVPLTELSDYQARLPYDLHRIIQVIYGKTTNGPWYSMRSATGSFDRERPDVLSTTSEDGAVVATSSLVSLAMTLYDLTYAEALTKVNSEPATRSILTSLISSDTTTGGTSSKTSNTVDYVYIATDSWIKANIETGYLMISYQAIPTDVEGYPLVPDSQSFLDALYWYITMKLLYPKWAAGQIRDAVYYDAKRSWNYYCKQAYGDAMMPDPDQMESIKNSWLRLVPNIDAHSSFYSSMGEQEIVWNNN